MKNINEIIVYKEFLKSNVKKDVRGKYKGSFLGVLWSFINPLLSVVVYAIVFHFIMRFNIEHYLIYLIAGIIPWTFFTTALNAGMNSILFNADIIKKVYFPRIILPISSVTSCLVNFLISCIIIVLFALFSGVGIGYSLLFLPIVVIIQYIFTLGLVFILGALEIYVRDIEHIVNFIISMLFYVTPILYTVDYVPDKFKIILRLNPVAYIIQAYHSIFYYKQMPNLINLGIISMFSILLFFIGYKVFDKLQRGFAEEI
ncbi:MAG: ABC transporter permease [Bacilli bacterium]|nr:ABC transporter permease [Bacilli bacterium]